MERFSKELQFVLQTLNPFTEQNVLKETPFTGLDEDKLIWILKKNKLFTKFSKKLDSQTEFRDEFLAKFKKIKLLNQDLKDFQTRDLSEFVRISKKLSKQDIHLLLIKSAGEFPHESSNIDCLIKPDKLASTVHILSEEGYYELLNSREPHKFLFRKKQAPKELPLHIHTRVEWEAVEFADPQNLRDRARDFMDNETGALVPSVEDAILITIAHYFFEDHEIKLYDLLKLWSLVNKENTDWGYIFRQAEKLRWNDALTLNLNLINRMSTCCFRRNMFEQSAEKNTSISPSWVSKIITFDSNGLLRIPYGVSALFFLRKVLRNPEIAFPEKSQQIIYVLSDLLRRRIIGYTPM